jgi:hypothetical protein
VAAVGRFHDELVAARRRGDAPGMGSEEESEPLLPTFVPIPEGVPLLACSRCGAAVPADRAPQHADRHVLIND